MGKLRPLARTIALVATVATACSDSEHGSRSVADAANDRDVSGAGGRDAGRSGAGGSGASRAGAGGARGGADGVRDGGDAAKNADASVDGSRVGPEAGVDGSILPDTGESVLERNKHPNRDGMFVQPLLTPAAAAKMATDTEFKATFSGAMYASPLYVEHGPGGRGVFFAVTVNNDVIALDETTGATVWKANIGPAPTATGVPCGNVAPVGIISTPVIDAASRTIYVAGAIGTSAISRHEVHALSVMDGTERPGFPVVVGGTSGGVTFNPAYQNQRSALSLVNGILYVAYGGHAGDCGPYRGWVIAIDTKNPAKTGAWATLGQGEGIWAAGGLASDGNGVFAITGNAIPTVADHMNSDSEEVVRITGLAVVDRSPKNIYFPSRWATMDAQDSDFGSSNPLYLDVPGGKPDHILFTLAKDGQTYFLDPANLGGMGGHLFTAQVALGPFSIKTVPAAYTSKAGVHVAMSSRGTGACPVPRVPPPLILSMVIVPAEPPQIGAIWCSPLAGAITGPIATTTDGTADPIVWYMSDGKLLARDGDTGVAIFDGGPDGGPDGCSGVQNYTSPIAVKGRIIVGGDGHLCSWSPH